MFNRIQSLVDDSPSSYWKDRPPKRVDLHCHSDASNEADEVVLNAIHCPESFSSPGDVYEQAMARRMDFVTITDHDSLDGIAHLSDKPNVLVGEELTCYFPEDHCKIHLLLWGITREDHDALQAVAQDIYRVANEVASRQLAHAVAHPVYRQNDRLERWHLERLLLLFKGFETLNGAHSVLHRQSVESLIEQLSPEVIADLAVKHALSPRWPNPHVKARTGGSDDHGLFNIGRTWTEFPGDVKSVEEILCCLREGRCRPGGEAGSSLKLAHNFYGVGIRYYGSKMRGESEPGSLHHVLLKSLIGEQRSVRKRDWMRAAFKRKARGLGRRIVRPFRKPAEHRGAALLMELFMESCGRRAGENGALKEALRNGRAALGEHAAMFDLVSALNRDITAGIADSVQRALGRGELIGLFDAVSSVAAHQFLLLPYYFSLFHQNRERHLLPQLTGRAGGAISRESLKLGVFTDTFDELNGVGRFIRDMSHQARDRGLSLLVHTSTANPQIADPSRKNFVPLLSRALPYYADQPLTLPPMAEVLEWADRQQFDAIHVHTPGPMGLCGWLVAKMLRIPVLGTYHTDFPQYVQKLTGDHRLCVATTSYMKWFYGQTDMVFSRSKDYRDRLGQLGFSDEKLTMTLPGVDTDKFTPAARDLSIWTEFGVRQPNKLLYAGRISLEKNLPFLADAFKQLYRRRKDVALVIAGEGPYQKEMQLELEGLPVYFLGLQNDEQLAPLYASSDLFVFPSKTDTLGQVVLEAQASGLPVFVSDQGGPREVTDDDITGRVLPANNPMVWTTAIDALLNDEPRRSRMSRSAVTRMARFSLSKAFEVFWEEHHKAVSRREQAMEKQGKTKTEDLLRV